MSVRVRQHSQIRIKRLLRYSFSCPFQNASFSFCSDNTMFEELYISQKIDTLLVLSEDHFFWMKFHLQSSLDEIGRMLGGWRRSLE